MKFEAKFVAKILTGDWKHYAWICLINDVPFEYKTGLGHVHKSKFNTERPITPTKQQVLECLFDDAEAGNCSFHEFCSNYGYDEDSRKAESIYFSCQEIGEKLRKALGTEFTKLRDEYAAIK